MPILTGTILARSPSLRKTTSMGLATFLMALFVPAAEGSLATSAVVMVLLLLLVAAAAELLVRDESLFAASFVLSPFLSLSLSLGRRVVTLAMGTVSTLVRLRVSISAVTDMPGLNSSFSWIRILTWNLVASWLELVLLLLPGSPLVVEELAISVTVPLNLRSLNESTS